MRRLPFLLRPRTWGCVVAGAALGWLLWMHVVTGPCGRRCDPEAHEGMHDEWVALSRREKWGRSLSAAAIGAFPGFLAAYSTDLSGGRGAAAEGRREAFFRRRFRRRADD